jgi:starch phosphorylase
MASSIRPLQEFQVSPALPEALSRLPEIAYNLVWSWDHQLRMLFRRLDPAMWRLGHNPVLMLNRLPQEALERAAADPRYLSLYQKACERFDQYMKRPPMDLTGPSDAGLLIAYFSMEYGLAECLPIYSGGLGVLSGDHLKGASDAGLPLVAVGLLYQKGYHQQTLNADGWQIERYPVNDPFLMPLRPVMVGGSELKVSVRIQRGTIVAKVWWVEAGRVKLYLLDTNIPDNPEEFRGITENLYGGDSHTRIKQEIVLGIGGMRALKALGLHPTVCHMNEGHAAFLALERIRDLMDEQKLTFAEAWEATRESNVFTTHTCVPAGIDLFDGGLVWDYLQEFCRAGGITIEQLFTIGRKNTHDSSERFSMAVAAMNTSAFRNAVSLLHGHVSREMWGNLWPGLPASEVPITAVTNGVHLPTMLNGDLASVYDQYLQPDWRERYQDREIWKQVHEIPSQELWESHRRRKKQLTVFVRQQAIAAAERRRAPATEIQRLEDLFDSERFTIGFARRFATYKRATLLFRDPARLKRLLLNPAMPAQIVIAGKAHPQDTPGKGFIREIVQFSRDPEIAGRVIFLENYDLRIAKEMVQGVDLWLNTPRRGEEACGTSGMKAAINGVLNLSILDGWFDEAYETSGCWAIGGREPYSEDQDAVHASDIYSLLEGEILPLYYRRDAAGIPEGWLDRVRRCLETTSPQFNTQRMLSEYLNNLYRPANTTFQSMRGAAFAPARQKVQWTAAILNAWDRVQFREITRLDRDKLVAGAPLLLRAVVDLAGLTPGDLRVEAVLGRVGPDGSLEAARVVELVPGEQTAAGTVFSQVIRAESTGRLGYAIRVSPNHSHDPLRRPCNSPVKWG